VGEEPLERPRYLARIQHAHEQGAGSGSCGSTALLQAQVWQEGIASRETLRRFCVREALGGSHEASPAQPGCVSRNHGSGASRDCFAECRRRRIARSIDAGGVDVHPAPRGPDAADLCPARLSASRHFQERLGSPTGRRHTSSWSSTSRRVPSPAPSTCSGLTSSSKGRPHARSSRAASTSTSPGTTSGLVFARGSQTSRGRSQRAAPLSCSAAQSSLRSPPSSRSSHLESIGA
jgi:hypothetical protein